MADPKVTVIIPTYNRWPYVCQAIDSVLKQSYLNAECLVVDDASTDGSYEKLRNKYGERIVLLRNEENKERSYSRNRGVIECNADFICFLDSDDILTQDSIQQRLNVFFENRSFPGVSFGINVKAGAKERYAESFFKKGKYETLELNEFLSNTGWVHINSLMINRNSMLYHGMFNEALVNREDDELIIRLLCKMEFLFCGAVVSKMREIDKIRSRYAFEKIIEQGTKFSEALKKDSIVSQRLGPMIRELQKKESAEILRAYYYSGRYREYRTQFQKVTGNKLLPNTFKFYKRYFLSYIKESLKKVL